MSFLVFIFIAYITIGALLSMYWVKESVKAADGEWDALAYLFRCCFKWPCLISNKDLR